MSYEKGKITEKKIVSKKRNFLHVPTYPPKQFDVSGNETFFFWPKLLLQYPDSSCQSCGGSKYFVNCSIHKKVSNLSVNHGK